MLQYGHKQAHIVWVDLRDGTSNRSPSLTLNIDDFTVRDDQLLVSHFELIKRKKPKVSRRQYSVSAYSLKDFSLLEKKWAGYGKPLVAGDRVYSRLVGYSTDGPSTVIATPMYGDSTQDKEFEGDWLPLKEDCKSKGVAKNMSSNRFHIEINECGMMRGFDFDQRRVFRFPLALTEQFNHPKFSLSKNLLIVQGKLKNANRGAGDSGWPIYIFDLAQGEWQGRLYVARYDSTLVAANHHKLVLYRQGTCANPYGTITEAGTLAAPITLQEVDFLEDKEIGQRGADIAKQFRAGLVNYQDPSFVRFHKVSGKITQLYEQGTDFNGEKKGALQPGLKYVRLSIGAINLHNSKKFNRHIGQLNLHPQDVVRKPYACEYLDLPTYENIEGERTGMISVTITPGIVDIEAKGWIADEKNMQLSALPIYYPPNLGATLLVYERSGKDWFRLTIDGEPALWINTHDISDEFSKAFSAHEPAT